MITPERMREIENEVWGAADRPPWDEVDIAEVQKRCAMPDSEGTKALKGGFFFDCEEPDIRMFRRLVRRELGLPVEKTEIELVRECLEHAARLDNLYADPLQEKLNVLLALLEKK